MTGQQLKSSILKMAIQGKLVPQDPHEEPATELLKRIQAEKKRLVKEGEIKKSALVEIPISEDEIPYDAPMGWEFVRLSDIAIFGGGKTPSMDNRVFWDNGKHLWVTSKDMKCNRISDSQMKISDEALLDMHVYEPDTLLMVTRSGILKRMLPLAILTKRATVNQDIKTITLIKPSFSEYIYYAIIAQESFILKEYHKYGTTVDSINFEDFKNIILPIPPLQEQHRIVEKIEKILPFVERYGKSQDALDKLNISLPDKLRQSILQEAIQGHLVPQDPNDEPASVLLDKIRNEKARLVKEGKLKKKDLEEKPISPEEIPFDIPEGWEWIRLNNLALVARGGSPRPIKDYITESTDGINWIKIGDTEKGGKYINSCEEKIKPEGVQRSRMVHPGDFLLTNSMSFGRPYITNVEGCIHDGWLVISQYYKGFDTDFLYYLLSSPFAYSQFSEKTAGAVVQNLNKDKVAESIFPLPPLSEQRRIVTKIEELMPKIDRLFK
jgi:type I restriction enzyme S subunit